MERHEEGKLQEMSRDLKKGVEEYQKLKQSKRDRLKELQQEQMKATQKIKEKIEQKAKLDRNRDLNLQEVKKVDQRI